MACIAKSVVELKELSKAPWDIKIRRIKKSFRRKVKSFRVEKVDAGVVTEDINMAFVIGVEASGESREIGKGFGEGLL